MAKEIGNLNVVVGLDATGFQNGIGNLNREMKKVQSEFRLASTEMGKGGKSLDSLKLKSDSLTKQVELQRQKVAALSSAHQNSVETKGEDAKATQELEIKLNKAKTQLSSMEQNLKRTNQEIELQSSSFYNLGKTLEPVGKKFQDVGKKMESVGKGLSKKITVPLTAIGAASTKLGVDFEAAMSEVGAISGATAEEIEVLEAAAREAGATTNKSATESAEALKYMALAGWDVETSQRALMPMLKLSSAGNMELGRTADLVTDGMSAMNLKIDDLDDYLNILTQTANNANTDIDQLGEAFVVVGGRLSLLEVETSEAATALGILGDNGIKGSEAGRGLNAILTNLTAPTGRAKVALDELGVSAFDTSGEFIGIEETLKLVETSMDGMTQEQQNMYMSMIAGKEHSKTFNALMSSLGGGFDDLKGKVEDSDGALEQMYGTMTDNTKGSIDNLKSALEELGLTIYDNLKPSIDWLVGILQSITDKMNSLSPETQQMIVRIGMVAAALGPLLIIGGKVVSGAGAIISAFSKASIALAGLKTGAATATTATGGLTSGFSVAGVAAKAGALLLNPWVLGIGAATVAGVALYKHLSEDSIPAIDLFGDEVSESTKQAVGGFLELNEEATLALNQLSWSGQEVTQEMADGITNNFSQMSAQILEELDTQHEESLGKIQNFVTNSTSLSQEEQDGILNNMQTGYENRKQAISDGEARIKEILDTASTEKRALTKEEQEEINSIQQEMVDTGIQVLSENEVEAKAIMERMKAQAGEITALQAAEVVRNSLEQKDGAIQAAEEQYNDVIKEIIRQRDEAGTISEDQADKLIEEAKRQRDETVDRAEEMHEDVVKEAKEQAKEHVNQVDWETGEVMSKWQVMKRDVSSRAKDIKEDVSEKWSQIKKDSSEKWENIKKDTSEKWTDMKTDISTKVKDIKNDVVEKWEDIRSSTEEKWGKVKTAVSDSIENVKTKVSEGIDKIKEWNNTSVKEKVFSIVEKVKSIFTSDKVDSNFAGTSFFQGGLTMVGELGPELVALPKGSRIYNHNVTKDMLSGDKGITQNIVINSPSPLTPYNTARQIKNASRQLALEW